MKLTPLENRVDERVLVGTHPTGMRVHLIVKPEHEKTFGVLATNFGSIDHRVESASGVVEEVPDGVAHFLEHKMFEDEEGDVSDRFAALGASTNASTGFTTTSYIFSATRHVGECLDLLLDFVLKPYFTDELVAKEQGIIAQEIRMYDDDPSWRIFFNLLQALYRNHPVRVNITGSEESIGRIDPRVLHACHRAFYRPANMNLTLVGGFDVDDVSRRIDLDLSGRTAGGPGARRTLRDDEPVRATEVEEVMDVARPKLVLGYRDAAVLDHGIDLLRREILSNLVVDLLFGRASETHEELYASGLIDDTFAAEYSGDETFGFVSAGGDTDEPERLEEALGLAVEGFVGREPSAEEFERVRNRIYGRFVSQFDSIAATAYAFSNAAFQAVTPFDLIGLVERLRPADVATRAREMFDPSLRARSIIRARAGLAHG